MAGILSLPYSALCAVSILYITCCSPAVAFNPNLGTHWLGTTSGSQTHKQITQRAVRDAAIAFMDDHPDVYPDQEVAMATDDFKEAIGHFASGAVLPDVERHLAGVPRAHFDDEALAGGTRRLLEERVKVITALNADDVTSARDLSGQLLHTLQDFYSHSSWVELHQEVFVGLGTPQGTLGNVAEPEMETCVDCEDKSCHENLADGVYLARKLTSGYRGHNPSAVVLTPGASGETVVDEVLTLIADSGVFPEDKCFMRRVAIKESKFGTDPRTYREGYDGGIWQVDDDPVEARAFKETKNTASHPGLVAKHRAIKEKFGIEWPSVEWSELRKPLYSGLAARLYVSLIPAAIPETVTAQAQYWKDHYNGPDGAGTAEQFVTDMEALEKPGDCPPPSVKAKKCSHGGEKRVPGDEGYSVHVGACGGINKDTNSEEWSPHHYLHHKAAELALESSVAWLAALRQVRDEEEYARYLGLSRGSSLCFVVDTTGSMSDEIAAVRVATQRITESRAQGAHRPSDFILVPFNDPAFGPTYKTEDSKSFIAELGTLSAEGGGDSPELAFTGMRLALQAVRPGSECFVFTDAGAKDINLATEVNALAVDKKVKMNFFLTVVARRRKRSARAGRVRRSTVFDPYTDLASVSGGQAYHTIKSDIEGATNVVDAGISRTKVAIAVLDGLSPPDLIPAKHVIPVDASMSDVIIQISSVQSLSGIFTIADPAGVEHANDSSTVVMVSSLSNLRMYKIPKPEAGLWTLSVDTGVPYSLTVTASSVVDFTYRLVEPLSGDHPGFRAVDGKPLAERQVTLNIDLFGGLSSVTGKQYPGGMQVVTALVLVDVNGTEMLSLIPATLLNKTEYEASFMIPTQGFRVVLRGVDTAGHQIQRYDTSVVTTALNSLRLELDTDGSPTAPPGEQVSIAVKISNIGPEREFSVAVSDSEGYFQTVMPSSLVLGTNSSGHVTMTFLAPENAPLGEIATVTVSAFATDGSTDNFLVFRLAATPKTLDMDPPSCNITDLDGFCNETSLGAVACQNETWSITFTTADTGLGLVVVRPSRLVASATLNVTAFSSGETEPVYGVYTSDCCTPRVTIAASDLLGNTGVCHVDHAPEPPPPSTGDDPPGSNLYELMLVLVLFLAFGLFVVLVFSGASAWYKRNRKGGKGKPDVNADEENYAYVK